jgi:hypothetical protein
MTAEDTLLGQSPKGFFCNLRELASKDLSQAHLTQHFTAAKLFAEAGNYPTNTRGTWSAVKPLDTLQYADGTVSGKKHWVSGVALCDWVVVPAQTPAGPVVVVIDKKYLNIEPVATVGMENTLTVNFTCEQAPVTYLYSRNDPRSAPADQLNGLSFVTIQLGLSIAAYNDIDQHTKSIADLNYIKTKVKLDIETLDLLWNYELDRLDEPIDWNRGKLVYSFAKKTILGVAHLVTEITSSGLFQSDMPTHQRYKDLLIYTTHMRNLFTATRDITQWSF